MGGSIVLAVALLVRIGGKWSFHCKTSIGKLSFPFLCATVANFLAVLLYTLTQPLIAKVYTTDSAIYSPRSQQQVYMPYMTHIWLHAVSLICLRTIVYTYYVYIPIYVYMCISTGLYYRNILIYYTHLQRSVIFTVASAGLTIIWSTDAVVTELLMSVNLAVKSSVDSKMESFAIDILKHFLGCWLVKVPRFTDIFK